MSGAHTNHGSEVNVENIEANDVPIYSAAELPESGYLPFVVEQFDPSCGADILALYHLPLSRVTPGGTFQTNTYSLAGKGATIEVPERQVIPAYVPVALPNVLTRASAANPTTLAQTIILEVDPNDDERYIVQGNGMYTFPLGHDYIIGYTYYLSEDNGQVTTEAPTNAQKLFTVLDSKTIQIEITGG